MRSTNYPVKHQLATSGEFNIYRRDCDGEDTQIFKGKAYINENIPSSGVVDIASIARHDISLDDLEIPSFQNDEGGIFVGTDNFNKSIWCIAYGNGIYIAGLAPSSGILAQGYYYSTDRENWTFSNQLRIASIAFGNGIFVAHSIVNGDNGLFSSTDGVTWTKRQTTGTNFEFAPVIYRNGTFMLFTNYVFKFYSTDGINWLNAGSTSITYTVGILRGEFDTVNNRWSLVYSEDVTNQRHYSSTNLITWYSQENIFQPIAASSVLYNGNIAIIGSKPVLDTINNPCICTGTIKTQTTIISDVLPKNTLEYERINIGIPGTNWWNIRYNDAAGMYVAVDSTHGQYAVSYDAYEWTLFQSLLDRVHDVLISDNGELTFVGLKNNYPAIYTSTVSDLVTVPSGQVKDYYIDNNPATYTIAYDYNTIYQSQIGDFRINNDPILNEVVPGQLLPISFYDKQCNRAKSIVFKNNGSQMAAGSSSDRSAHVWAELSLEGLSIGDVISVSITITDGGEQQTGTNYRVIDDCKIRYVVYYVNKLGGIDTLPIKGNTVESFTNSQFNIDHEYDRSNPADHQYKVIQNTALRRWQMNTGLLKNNEAEKIDHLLLTPKCWVHDLNEDIIYSARIYDTGFSVKKFVDNVQFANYTFNIEQAQDIIRRE